MPLGPDVQRHASRGAKLFAVNEFEQRAVAVANGDGWLMSTFASIGPGSIGVLDMDLSRHGFT